ncbi:MAG: plasmid maintenance protein CcdB [Hyphomicrobium sp.]|jgi:toxin CcdB|nr:plasmid maintenance protein CcdB [Hyphomicrobium sp.]PPD08842.1 MAG: plasmid maintenance protein CcdB [Hyphomicrobium sp.]
MRQFDVFAKPSEASRDFAPFVIVLQSDLTMTKTTVVVAPLVLPDRLPEPSRLFPRMHVGETPLVLSTSELAGIGRKQLRQHVTNLSGSRDAIIAALDLLFTGI